MAKWKGLEPWSTEKVFVMLGIVIAGIYLVGTFVGGNGFEVTGLSSTALTIAQILIVTFFAYIGYVIIRKAKGAPNFKDMLMILVIGLVGWFLWDKVLANVLQADSLSSITFSVGQKLGMFHP